MTAPVRGQTPTVVATEGVETIGPPAAPSLLPGPMALTGGAYADALGSVYVALSTLRDVDLRSGEETVTANQRQQAEAFADQIAAIQRQEANESGSGGGVLSSVGHVVSDAVNDVAHGNLAGAFTDVARDVSDAWNSPRFWGDVETGMKDVALIAEQVAQVAEQVGGEAGAIVAGVAMGVDEGALAAADLAHARSENFAAEVHDAQADVAWSKDELDLLRRAVDAALQATRERDQSYARALGSVSGAIETSSETLVLAACIHMKG